MMRRTLFALAALCALAVPAGAQSFGGYAGAGQLQIGQGPSAPPAWLTSVGPLTVNPSGIVSVNLSPSPYLTGLLGMANGGCNASLRPSAGALLYSTAVGCALLPNGPIANRMLMSGFGQNPIPQWSAAIWAANYAASSILYSSGPNNIQGLTPCALGIVGYSAASVPSCSATLPSGLTLPSPTITGLLTATGLVTLADLATQAANTVLANGTSGTASPTAFAMPSCSGAANAIQWLTNTGFQCGTVTASASSITYGTTTAGTSIGLAYNTSNGGALAALTPVSGGIIGATSNTTPAYSAALAQYGVVYGGGAGATPAATAAGTNGQLFLGQTSAAPAWKTAAGDVSSISAAGSFTFAASNTNITSLANLATVGTLTGGATGSGFTVALGSSTITGTLALGNGGTSQTTAAAARGSSGLNIDELTSHGDSNYTILATDRGVYHTALSAARTDTLPAANSVNAGQLLYIVDFAGVANSTDTITLQRAGSDTVNGSTSAVAINSQYGWSVWMSDGSSRWTYQQGGSGGGSGTVTSVATGNGLSGGPITTSGTLSANVDGTTIKDSGGPLVVSNTTIAGATCTPGSTCGLSSASNTLGSNVNITSANTYFTGPSMAQGTSGTWHASGTVTLSDPSTGVGSYTCKLWDGTTVIASSSTTEPSVSYRATISLSGILASPAGNIRISCANNLSSTSVIESNITGNSADSTIFGVRID